MEKLLKRVVSIVCAIAMVVSGFVFTPSSVDASEVPSASETQVGAWGLYAANEAWSGYATMEYDYSGGTSLDATKVTLTNSAHGNYNQVSWGAYMRLPKCLSTRNLQPDSSYKLKITAEINYPEGQFEEPNKDNGRGIILANIQGNVYQIPVTQEALNKGEFKMDGTFDYDIYAAKYGDEERDPDDLYLFTAGLMTGTTIKISEVSFINEDNGWDPVPNWNPDEHPGQSAQYQTYDMYQALAMRSNVPSTGLLGKMKVKKNASEDELTDYSFRVTQSGWVDMGQTGDKRSSWATSLRLPNYCESDYSNIKLVSGETYVPTIKLNSSAATKKDNKGRDKKIQVVIDGKAFETTLTEGVNEIEFDEFEYSGQATVDIDLDGVEDGTEISLESLTFSATSGEGWTAVPNEDTATHGKWDLFARTCTGIGDDNAQWGALSYKDAPSYQGGAYKLEDTLIKVRSSSGWHDAWATLGTVHHYIDTEPNKLEVGKSYKVQFTYYSSKETGTDMYGEPKTLLLSVDQNPIKFELENCGDNVDNFKTVTSEPFVYEAEQVENDPTAVVMNMDQIDKGTILRVKDIKFIEDTSYPWTPVPNDEWTGVPGTPLQGYARMGKTVQEGSWGKMSYKVDGSSTEKPYSNATFLNRSVSRWFVLNNPANAIDVINAKDLFDLHKGWTYNLKLTVSSTLTDTEAIQKKWDNQMRVMVDGKLLDVKDYTPNEEDPDDKTIKTIKTYDTAGTKTSATLESEEFVFTGASADMRLILDKLTKNSQFKIENIEFIHKEGEPEYQQVNNDESVKVGAWNLYCVTDSATGTFGDMLYAEKTGDKTLGDVEMYCYGTSGWFAGKTGIIATLPRYTKDTKPLTPGQEYSCKIKIKANKNIAGFKDDVQHNLRVTINNQNYDFEVYEGEYTYVIPKLTQPYAANVNDNIVFNFDTATPGTKITISDVDFSTPVEEPKEITEVSASANSNGTIDVNWTQTPETVYGTLAVVCGYNVYVDGVKQNTSLIKNNINSFTTTNTFKPGKYDVKVVAVMGATESTGKTTQVTISDQPTTQAPTQAPTQKPTVTPVTTKAPVVAKPGKAKVKKAVKKKKSAKKIKITLKKVAGAKKYQVAVYKTKKNAKKNKKALVKKTITKLTATIKSKKLKGKKTVYVRARAWNAAGFGAWSGVKKSKKK